MNYIYTLIPIALIGFAAVQGSKWNFNAATYMDKKYTNGEMNQEEPKRQSA